MNAPDRLDSIQVPTGLSKCVCGVPPFSPPSLLSHTYRPPLSDRIQIMPDEKMPNAATYRILREDHTLGHLLRM